MVLQQVVSEDCTQGLSTLDKDEYCDNGTAVV